MQAYKSTMCAYLSIRFIGFMLKVQSLLDYTNLFLSKKYEEW